MENTVNLQKFTLQFAIFAALGRILIDLIPKTLSFGAIAYYSTFFIAFFLEIIFIYFVIKKFKTKNSTLSLKQAIKIGLIIMLTLGLMYSIASYIYDTYIDPEYQVNLALGFVEKFAPEKLEETRATILESQKNKSFLGILTSTLWFVFLGFIISLITGSILKTKEEFQ